jgi:DNA-binding Lrp family transcriptional regulator
MFITVEPETEKEVLCDLKKIEGITEASLIYGGYDIHCKIAVENMEKLSEFHQRVRRLRILNTLTLISKKIVTEEQRNQNQRLRKIGTLQTSQ